MVVFGGRTVVVGFVPGMDSVAVFAPARIACFFDGADALLVGFFFGPLRDGMW